MMVDVCPRCWNEHHPRRPSVEVTPNVHPSDDDYPSGPFVPMCYYCDETTTAGLQIRIRR